MAFTDENLKRLKEELVGHDPRLVTPLKREYPKFDSLLSRLEAAEAVCEATRRWLIQQGNISDVDLALIAWHKSCGKDGGV